MTRERPDSPLLPAGGWVWAVGIEDTIIGWPLRGSGLVLDEYALTQHDHFWRADLDRAASLGITAIRYGIPWHRVNPAPDRFDWHPVEEALTYAAAVKGLAVIADLVHYGTPPWLKLAFADPEYPRAVAAYAAAFARRFSSLIHHYTPLNEPLMTASFCGQRGIWPPYLEGDEGWLRVVVGVVDGIRETIAAIRAVDPTAVVVHVEAAKLLRQGVDQEGSNSLATAQARAFFPTDLLLGRVDDDHPLLPWARQNGCSPRELRRFCDAPPRIDLIGVNYYPELSARELVQHNGRTVEVTTDAWTGGLAEVLTAYWHRYGLPLMVSETSTEGDDERRVAWLHASTTTVARLRAAGLPIRGYTWWPLFDFVDWAYASGGQTIEEFWVRVNGPDGEPRLSPALPPAAPGAALGAFLRRMGAWRLATTPTGTLERVETRVVGHLRALAHRSVDELPTTFE